MLVLMLTRVLAVLVYVHIYMYMPLLGLLYVFTFVFILHILMFILTVVILCVKTFVFMVMTNVCIHLQNDLDTYFCIYTYMHGWRSLAVHMAQENPGPANLPRRTPEIIIQLVCQSFHAEELDSGALMSLPLFMNVSFQLRSLLRQVGVLPQSGNMDTVQGARCRSSIIWGL